MEDLLAGMLIVLLFFDAFLFAVIWIIAFFQKESIDYLKQKLKGIDLELRYCRKLLDEEKEMKYHKIITERNENALL